MRNQLNLQIKFRTLAGPKTKLSSQVLAWWSCSISEYRQWSLPKLTRDSELQNPACTRNTFMWYKDMYFSDWTCQHVNVCEMVFKWKPGGLTWIGEWCKEISKCTPQHPPNSKHIRSEFTLACDRLYCRFPSLRGLRLEGEQISVGR